MYYRLTYGCISNIISGVIRQSDSASIPFDPANTDYQRFKTEVLAGASLQDAEGATLTAEAAQSYIATLP